MEQWANARFSHCYDATPRVEGLNREPLLFFRRDDSMVSLMLKYDPTQNRRADEKDEDTKTGRGITCRKVGGSGDKKEGAAIFRKW